MIPRFIVRNIDKSLLDAIIAEGLKYEESMMPPDIMVIGDRVIKAPSSENNPLIRTFDGSRNENLGPILAQAKLHYYWNAKTEKVELALGTDEKGKVTVTRLGVLIDSFLIPIELFRKFHRDLLEIRNPFIASHPSVINPAVRFMTIGCADYSLQDLEAIINTYNKLKVNK